MTSLWTFFAEPTCSGRIIPLRSKEIALTTIAILTAVCTLVIAFLLRFLIAMVLDRNSISVLPHLRVEIAHEFAVAQTSHQETELPAA